MKRTAGAIMLLAALGGCSSTSQDSDMSKRVVYDGRRPIPGPSDPSWTPNRVAASYANLPAAPYTRVGSAGKSTSGATLPATTSTASATAPAATVSTVPTAPAMNAASSPGVAALSDQGSSFSELTPPATSVADKAPSARSADNVLAMRDQMAVGDPPSLSTASSKLSTRSQASLPDALAAGPSLDATSPERYKDPVGQKGSKSNKTSEGLVTSAYMPAQNTAAAQSRLAMSGVRVVNNKRITLNYKINDVGPSGVSSIDVWVTHDGRVWKKLDLGTQTHPPCIVEVGDEGTYGFTLLARNGLGLGKAPPQAGDVPQVWVEVDLTKPMVHLIGVDVSSPTKGTAVISWNAADKNLGPRPITLSYSETGKGAWVPIAANLPNSGRYVWQMPSTVSGRFLVRVEATDLAGNTGFAQSQEPVMIDLSQPTISIVNVESGR